MRSLPLLSLITACTGLLVLPAPAKDKDKDDKKDRKHKFYSEEYDSERRRGVTIGVVTPRRSYYRPSSTVIIERERPVYYERQGYSSRSVEIEVQRGLARRGYYRGPIDGDIGPGSRAGIRAFQADNGLAPTGRIDRRLLDALR